MTKDWILWLRLGSSPLPSNSCIQLSLSQFTDKTESLACFSFHHLLPGRSCTVTQVTHTGLWLLIPKTPPGGQRLGLVPGPAQSLAPSLPKMMLAIRGSGGWSSPTQAVFLESTDEVVADKVWREGLGTSPCCCLPP